MATTYDDILVGTGFIPGWPGTHSHGERITRDIATGNIVQVRPPCDIDDCEVAHEAAETSDDKAAEISAAAAALSAAQDAKTAADDAYTAAAATAAENPTNVNDQELAALAAHNKAVAAYNVTVAQAIYDREVAEDS